MQFLIQLLWQMFGNAWQRWTCIYILPRCPASNYIYPKASLAHVPEGMGKNVHRSLIHNCKKSSSIASVNKIWCIHKMEFIQPWKSEWTMTKHINRINLINIRKQRVINEYKQNNSIIRCSKTDSIKQYIA